MTFIDSPADVLVTLAFLAGVVILYLVMDRFRPGAGQVPQELSAALKWLRDEADDGTILAWWDYAAPIRDHTGMDPLLSGPSRDLRDTIDKPQNVSVWDQPDQLGRVAAFLLADGPETALSHISADEFDYVLVARSDLLKATAMRQAAPEEAVAEPTEVFLRELVAGEVEWPVAYRNEEILIYHSPPA